MRKLYGKVMCRMTALRRRAGEILKDERGMGTVEVILIILEIFTQRWMLMRKFSSVGNKV